MYDRNAVYPLPLDPGMSLRVSADLVELEVEPVEDGNSPRLEIVGERPEQVGVKIRTGVGHVDVELEIAAVLGARPQRDARVRLFVPQNLTGRIETDAGSILIHDLEPHDLEVRADAGKVELRRVHGRLMLEADAGKITGHEVGGQLEVHCDAGSVELEIDELEAGEHRIHSDVGMVRVRLPRELPVRIDARTTLGAVRNHVASVIGAAALLIVTADMGTVLVEEGGRVREHDDMPRVRIPVSSAVRRQESSTRNGGTEPAPPIPLTPRESGDRATETARILEMVAGGALTPAEANDLLQALDQS